MHQINTVYLLFAIMFPQDTDNMDFTNTYSVKVYINYYNIFIHLGRKLGLYILNF